MYPRVCREYLEHRAVASESVGRISTRWLEGFGVLRKSMAYAREFERLVQQSLEYLRDVMVSTNQGAEIVNMD